MARERDDHGDGAVARALEALERAAASGAGVMEPTIDLARAGGTVGEWTMAIERATNGRYMPPVLDRTMALAPLKVPHARGASGSRSARPGWTAISTRSSCSRTPACRPGWK